jgi:Fuc2NAc and GlcNAc transferase
MPMPETDLNLVILITVYGITALLAWWITAWARRYALKRAILDHPNHRSSHSEPTPRGGGIAIAVLIMAAVMILWLTEYISLQLFLALGGGGFLVATVGWIDDRWDISVVWRAASYLAASAWAVYWITDLYAADLRYGFWMYAGVVVLISWLVNLYNFMDGTDGLAAAEGISTASIAAILLLLAGQDGIAILLMVLSAACSGFLILNWPPAKIFMGDIGSCLIGFLFGAVAFISYLNSSLSPAVWLILLSIFICDASLTLLKRILNREKWYSAHRSHAYQLFVQAGFSHKQLLTGLLLVNLLLFPFAVIAYYAEACSWWLTAGVYCLMGSLWLFIQLKYRQSRI